MMDFKHHILLAGLLFVGAVAFIAVRNWDTVSTVVDNATALNEGGTRASAIRSPADFADYLAAHPEQVSLVAFDVGASDPALRLHADSVRALAAVPRMLLLAEYVRQAASGRIDPERAVPVDSASAFALPGVTAPKGQAADSLWWTPTGESLALRDIARRVAVRNDDVAADWLWSTLGPQAVRTAPNRLGLPSSTAPQSTSGRYLAWTQPASGADAENRELNDADLHRRLEAAAARSDEAHWARTTAMARRLQSDAAFRRQVRDDLEVRGSRLSLRRQEALTQATGPRGTAADYAALAARIATGRDHDGAPKPQMHTLLERTLTAGAPTDSSQFPFQVLAVQSGASPGVLSFAGYARRTDGRTRAIALFMDGLPYAVLYHLLQTGIDKGFVLQLLGDDAFFERMKRRFDPLARAPT